MFNEALRALRRKHRVSQQKIGDITGVSAVAVGKWERGTSEPDIAKLLILADFFGVTLDELCGREMKPTEPVHPQQPVQAAPTAPLYGMARPEAAAEMEAAPYPGTNVPLQYVGAGANYPSHPQQLMQPKVYDPSGYAGDYNRWYGMPAHPGWAAPDPRHPYHDPSHPAYAPGWEGYAPYPEAGPDPYAAMSPEWAWQAAYAQRRAAAARHPRQQRGFGYPPPGVTELTRSAYPGAGQSMREAAPSPDYHGADGRGYTAPGRSDPRTGANGADMAPATPKQGQPVPYGRDEREFAGYGAPGAAPNTALAPGMTAPHPGAPLTPNANGADVAPANAKEGQPVPYGRDERGFAGYGAPGAAPSAPLVPGMTSSLFAPNQNGADVAPTNTKQGQPVPYGRDEREFAGYGAPGEPIVPGMTAPHPNAALTPNTNGADVAPATLKQGQPVPYGREERGFAGYGAPGATSNAPLAPGMTSSPLAPNANGADVPPATPKQGQPVPYGRDERGFAGYGAPGAAPNAPLAPGMTSLPFTSNQNGADVAPATPKQGQPVTYGRDEREFAGYGAPGAPVAPGMPSSPLAPNANGADVAPATPKQGQPVPYGRDERGFAGYGAPGAPVAPGMTASPLTPNPNGADVAPATPKQAHPVPPGREPRELASPAAPSPAKSLHYICNDHAVAVTLTPRTPAKESPEQKENPAKCRSSFLFDSAPPSIAARSDARPSPEELDLLARVGQALLGDQESDDEE